MSAEPNLTEKEGSPRNSKAETLPEGDPTYGESPANEVGEMPTLAKAEQGRLFTFMPVRSKKMVKWTFFSYILGRKKRT